MNERINKDNERKCVFTADTIKWVVYVNAEGHDKREVTVTGRSDFRAASFLRLDWFIPHLTVITSGLIQVYVNLSPGPRTVLLQIMNQIKIKSNNIRSQSHWNFFLSYAVSIRLEKRKEQKDFLHAALTLMAAVA